MTTLLHDDGEGRTPGARADPAAYAPVRMPGLEG
jgi:hypothetical protein